MSVLEKVSCVVKRIVGFCDKIYESLPLNRWNEFLNNKSIRINLRSKYIKYIFRSLLLFLFICLLSLLFSSSSTAEYEIDDSCRCEPPVVQVEPVPVDERDLSSFAGYAGDGDLKSVKYFVENHYDKIGDRQWKEAIDFAVNGRHIDVAEYLIKKQDKIDESYQVWAERINGALNVGSCKTLNFVLKYGKKYIGNKQLFTVYKHECDPVMEAVGSVCKLEVCFNAGFVCLKKSNYLSRAIGVCYSMIGTVWTKKQTENAELKYKQNNAETILMANLKILLDNGADDFSSAIDALCEQPVLRLQNRLNILRLFERYGYKVILNEKQIECLFSEKMIREASDPILKRNDAVCKKILKKWSEGGKVKAD